MEIITSFILPILGIIGGIVLIKKFFKINIPEKQNKKQKIIENFDKYARRQFEKQIAEVLQTKGYEIHLGPGFFDGGIDIRARKKLQILLIQCKHWWGNRQVGVKEIREFQGAISLYNKEFKNDGKGIFITTGRSTEYAKEEAKKLGIELRDENNYIKNLIKKID